MSKFWKITRRLVAGGAIAAMAISLISGIGALAAVPTAVALGISAVTSIASTVAFGVAGLGVAAMIGAGIINAFKFAFNRNYRNQVLNRNKQRSKEKAKDKEKEREEEKEKEIEEEMVKGLEREEQIHEPEPEEELTTEEAPVETSEEELATEEAPVETSEEELTTEEAPVETSEEELTTEEAPVETSEEELPVEEAPVEMPTIELPTEEAPVEMPTVELPSEDKPVEMPTEKAPVYAGSAKRAEGLYNSMSEENRALYDVIVSRTARFKTVFKKLTAEQYDVFYTMAKEDVAVLKSKDPSTYTVNDVKSLALYDRMSKNALAAHVVSEKGNEYRPTKKQSKKMTEQEIIYKSNEIALDELMARTEVSQEELDAKIEQNKAKAKNRK